MYMVNQTRFFHSRTISDGNLDWNIYDVYIRPSGRGLEKVLKDYQVEALRLVWSKKEKESARAINIEWSKIECEGASKF